MNRKLRALSFAPAEAVRGEQTGPADAPSLYQQSSAASVWIATEPVAGQTPSVAAQTAAAAVQTPPVAAQTAVVAAQIIAEGTKLPQSRRHLPRSLSKLRKPKPKIPQSPATPGFNEPEKDEILSTVG